MGFFSQKAAMRLIAEVWRLSVEAAYFIKCHLMAFRADGAEGRGAAADRPRSMLHGMMTGRCTRMRVRHFRERDT